VEELEQRTVQREIMKPLLWIWKVVRLLSNEHEQVLLEQAGAAGLASYQ
jgi:hypothetical protein